MVPAWLWLLCLSIPQALSEAQLAELHVEVPENYGGKFPLYLTKLPLPRGEAEGKIVLSGNSGMASESPFAVDRESGFLMVTRALDREEQPEYQLQVALETDDGRVLWGPQPVLVHVKDENDQVPHFSQAIYSVRLSQGTRPGIPFLFLEASDEDEPGTANSDLRFHILNQAPAQPFPDMFQLEPQLGALALSPKGSTSLDQALEGPYQLLVQVKDMGDQASGHQATATVNISIVESTWMPLEPIHLAENLKVPYPHHISQVRWSGEDVHYHLESQPPGPFDVDTKGKLYVTMELDRESQAEYLLQVRAQNTHGEDYTEPLKLLVVVMDENDNAPACPPRGPPIRIPELSPAGLSSTCEVTVTITDINDHAPEFTTSQIEPISLPEDTEPGTLVATLLATDGDLEPAFRRMDFAIEAGDVDGAFGLKWEPDSGHVQLLLLKNLSYETAPSYQLVVVVRSEAELVGPGPGPGATATVTVLVEKVVPPPKLNQESYEASVPVSTPAGSLLLTIQPSDPMSSPLRFSLVNDSEGWLCIKEVSGEVHTARPLQGARPGDMYTVLVEAQDAGEPTLRTAVTLVIHFLKAGSASAPALPLVPTRHLCTPRKNHGVVVSGASEDTDLADGHGPYHFALGPNPTVQRDWRIQALNGSHAYLTLALHWVEPREYSVPVVVSHNNRMWQLLVRVIVCRCNAEGQCMRKVGRMKGMPTKLSAVGILGGTLLAIGIFLVLIFTHLSLARKKDPDQPADSVPLKAAV
ncbi:cadherin-16 isoform X2 [Myotis lucifugus]|uniref:cadherin-16 isoform X2 n=1 Tax=Myotis lucifugus TaxID=59463 RepID=UPI000CCC4668|nr:cadherin-16 isoform X2 [Myotis lucifugus]